MIITSGAFDGWSVFELYLKKVILHASPEHYRSGYRKVSFFTLDFIFLQNPTDDEKSQN